MATQGRSNFPSYSGGAINPSNLMGFPIGDPNKTLLGDGTWGRGLTTRAVSLGPPANPVDGDVWVATGVGANASRWQFQYDATWATDAFKWKFIGGPPLMLSEDASLTTTSSAASTGSGAGNPAVTTFTAPRAGVYQARTVAAVSNNSTNINSFQFENNAVPQLAVTWDSVSGTVVGGVVFSEMEVTMTAATLLRTLISTTGGTFGISLRRMSVIPVRVS
jgi:hypothetical protein